MASFTTLHGTFFHGMRTEDSSILATSALSLRVESLNVAERRQSNGRLEVRDRQFSEVATQI